MKSVSPSDAVVGLWLPCRTLIQREIVRFLRQRSRIIGALGTPLIFWLMVGGGLGRSFSLGASGGVTEGAASMTYMQYTFPGALAAILLFTSIFAMISIIDDRREGFMQGVLVAPVPRLAIVLGKVMGASILAIGQAAVFLLLAPTAGVPLSIESFLLTAAAMIPVAIAVTALGFWLAWIMDSTQGFHGIMNLLLMPMLVLSGAFFPPSGSAAVLRWITLVNPMTYSVALLRHAVFPGGSEAVGHVIDLWAALGVTVAFALLMIGISIFVAIRDSARAAQ
ncbi:MAG: ABC transporter permease [Phycisphaerae bacterium]|nr:ABC transporter permease [Phycisphaerae bacterium]